MKIKLLLLAICWLPSTNCTFNSCPCAQPCPPEPICVQAIQPPIHVSTVDCCPVGCVLSSFPTECVSCRRHRERSFRREQWNRQKRGLRRRSGSDVRFNEGYRDMKQFKCNSERLRSIIRKAVGAKTSTLKRNIQLMAEKTLKQQYNVLCGRGDFSYITTTDEYCQDEVFGRTCYVFARNLDDQ